MTTEAKKSTCTDVSIRRTTLSELIRQHVKGGVHVAVISDVHLGHNRVHASKVIEVLDSIFPVARLEYLDVVVITGDLFDKRLTFDSDEAHLITRWMKRFMRLCKSHDVSIRILEGTPSHDNRQSRWMPWLNELSEIGADVKYYDKLSIDVLYEGGPTVLYVPDEVNHDANDTWLQVNALLRENGLDAVDFAFMHGMFTYQEPIRTVVSHNIENYHSIVRQRIIIGHHHTHTVCGRIVVPGSTERLRHNEEEEKGHYEFTIVDGEAANDSFIVNEEATIFTTLDVQGMSFVDVVQLLESQPHPIGSHLRLKMSRNDPAYPSLRDIRIRFPHYNLTTKIIEAESYTPDSGDLINRPTITAIRADTIGGLIMTRVFDVSPAVRAAMEKILANG